ncbi:cytochrome C assembly family protein [Paludisphaera soli]|uniref:cytochrome C assembly family protein n=1 Tax=Paludisphaera soli TaxID=2712865 RepID=UPI0013ED2F2B|nr:cytochrome c biogenesis protein CcsA [Paludisphaera soli]
MDRLQILCFAGTYGLALAVELARLFVRSELRWHLGVGLTFLGWCVQTLYLANIAWSGRTPLPVTSAFESVMVLSWVVALIGLYLMVQWPRKVAVGFFTLPLVLGLILGAAWFVPRAAEGRDWEGATAFWGTVHGIFLLAGAVCASLAFAAGLMYLAQMRRLKSKQTRNFGFSLPSLEQSERVNRGAIVAAFPLLTAGLLIGALLSAVELRKGGGGPHAGVPWYDPKVLSAFGMWLVFAGLLHARFRPSMRGRTVMMLTIAAFAFLVFTWVGVEALRLPTAHGAPRTAGGPP